MNRRKVVLSTVSVLAGGALLMFLFLGMREEQPRRSPQPRMRIVDVHVVELGPVGALIEAFGTVASAAPVEIYSEVGGIIQPGDITFRPAQAFRKNDLLLRIDDRQVQLDRQAAISDLLNALANVLPEIKIDFPDAFPEWQNYFNGVRFDAPIATLPETASQRIKLFLSRFNVYRLYFAVRNLEVRQEKHEIRAPFNGTILSADLRAGSTARNGSKLGTLISLEALEVEVPVPAPEIPWIDFEGPVSFTSSEFDGQWQGHIRRVGQAIDGATQSIPVYVELDQATGALPQGTFFAAVVPGEVIEDAVEVTRRAIYSDRFVYVVENGQLAYREVEIARAQTETVIVNGGLHNGDSLIVEPLQGASPGMPAQARLVAGGEQAD